MEEKLVNNNITIISKPAEVDMADDWYDIASLDHFWIKARFEAIKRNRVISQLSNARLLEIGCGHGLIIKQFETLSNVVTDGCDLNMLALNKVGEIKGDLYSLDIFDNPPILINRYDGILLMDVIEHIDDDVLFVKESCKFLKKDGLVVINVPALNSLFSDYDIMAGHKRRYTKKMLEEVFEKNDIEKISIEYWGLFMIPIAILRKVVLKFTPKKNIINLGFRPPNTISNWFLTKLSQAENFFFSSPFSGTSVVAVGKLRK